MMIAKVLKEGVSGRIMGLAIFGLIFLVLYLHPLQWRLMILKSPCWSCRDACT